MKDGGTALRWGIGIMIYLVLEFLVVFSVMNGLSAMHQKPSAYATDVFGSGIVVGCGQPRVIDNVSYTQMYASSLKCGYIQSEAVCNSTLVCHWSNDSALYRVNCLNPIAVTQNLNTTVVQPSYFYDTAYDTPKKVQIRQFGWFLNPDWWLMDTTNESFWNAGTPIDLSTTPKLQGNKTICEGFGFTWYTNPTVVQTQNDFSKVTTSLSTMFGFSAKWCDDSDAMCISFSKYFSYLFSWIPLTALGICVYLMIPLI